MAKVPPTVPKSPPPRRVAFDEQLWPVNVAILVMGGFVVGAILATCRLDDPRFFYNGSVRLAGLAGVLGLLIWGVSALDSRRVRRGLQLAALVSLFTHIGAMVVLHSQRFDEVATTTRPVVQPSDVLVRGPRFPSFDPELSNAQNELTKPTEARIAPEQEQPLEVARKPAELEEAPKSPPTPVPGTTPGVRPNVVEKHQLEEARPSKASPESRPGKQVAKVELPKAESAAVPQTKPENHAPTIDARANSLDRRPQELAAAWRSDMVPEKTATAPQMSRLAKREKADPAAPAVAPPSAAAKVRKAPSASPDQAKAPQSAAQESRRPQLDSTATVSRQAPADPVTGKAPGGAEPEAARITQLASLDNRPRAADRRANGLPQLSAPKAAASSRTPQAPLISAEIGASPQLPAGRGREAEPSAAPAPTRVARAEAGAGLGPASDPLQGAANPLPIGKSAVRGAPIGRADEASVPGLTTAATAGKRVTRARRAAKVEAAPVAMEGPGIAESAEPGQPAAEPGRRTKLARRATSVPGVGVGDSVQPGLVGPREAASLPAAATKRAAAAQQSLGDGSIAGSGVPPQMARSALGKRVPSAAAVAQDVAIVGLGGLGGADGSSTGPAGNGRVEASSNATVQRAEGTGILPGTASGGAGAGAAGGIGTGGPGTGAAGTGGLDIGPGHIGSNSGPNRSSAGGAPRVSFNSKAQRIAKSGLGGGGGAAAISTQIAAPAPESPSGSGGGASSGDGGEAAIGEGGGSPVISLSPNGSVAVGGRGAGGGGLPTGSLSAIASIDLPEGAGGGQGGTGRVARAAMSRADTAGAANGGQSGGGQPGGGRGIPRSTGRSTANAVAAANADVVEISDGSGTGGSGTDGTGTSEPGSGTGGGGESPEPSNVVVPRFASIDAGRGSAGLPTGSATGQADLDALEVGSSRPQIAGNSGQAPQKRAAAADGAPQVAANGRASAMRKANSLPAGVVAEINGAALDIAAEGSTPSASDVADVPPPQSAVAGQTNVARQTGAGALPLEVALLPQPPGGLGSGASPEVGLLNRRTPLDSAVLQPGAARFLSRKTGGPLAIDGRARLPTEAYAGRAGQRKVKKGGGGLAERNEQAIAKGLDFLMRHQLEDGRWSLNNFGAGRPGYEEEHASFQSDTAATGLALLSFLGAGYDHFDDEYRHVVREGLDFLLRNQKPDGDLYLPMDAESNKSAWFYSHGIATIALCEAYGMTGDEALRGPAQKALDFIMSSQSPRLGVWRYAPQYGSDTSASGWQLMALKSGELAGLKIAPQTYPRVKRWLDAAQVSKTDGSQYVYNPLAADTDSQRHGRKTSSAMTAVGLLMRLYLGWNRNDPQMIAGAEHLLQDLPAMGTSAQPQRDTYYWYYATQVMFHMRGKYWKEWNDRLHPLLVERQVQTGPMAGSWDPLGSVPDRWGPAGGRIYVTTLNLLSLEVYYRHLPIYEATAK